MRAQLSDKISSESSLEEWFKQVAAASPEERLDKIESVILRREGWLLYAHAKRLKPLLFVGAADDPHEAFIHHEFSTIPSEFPSGKHAKSSVQPQHARVVKDSLRFAFLSAVVEEATARRDTGRRNRWLSSLLHYCGLLTEVPETTVCHHGHIFKGIPYSFLDGATSRRIYLNLQSSYHVLGIDGWFVWLRQVLHPADSFPQIRCRLHAAGWSLVSQLINSLLPNCEDSQQGQFCSLSESRTEDGGKQTQENGHMLSASRLQEGGPFEALPEGLSPAFFGICIQRILPTLRRRPVRRQGLFFEGLAAAILVLGLSGNASAASVLLLQAKELLLQLPQHPPPSQKLRLTWGSADPPSANGAVWLLRKLSAAGGRVACKSLYAALSFIDMYCAVLDPRGASRFAGLLPVLPESTEPVKGEARSTVDAAVNGGSALLARLLIYPVVPFEDEGASWLLLERLLLLARCAILPHLPALSFSEGEQGAPEEASGGPSSGAGSSPSTLAGALSRIKSLGLAVTKTFSRSRPWQSSASAELAALKRQATESLKEMSRFWGAGELSVAVLLAASWCLLDERVAMLPCKGGSRALGKFGGKLHSNRGRPPQGPIPSLVQRSPSADLDRLVEFVEAHTGPSLASPIAGRRRALICFSRRISRGFSDSLCAYGHISPSPSSRLPFGCCFFDSSSINIFSGDGRRGTGDSSKKRSVSALPECAKQGMKMDMKASCASTGISPQGLGGSLGRSAGGCSLAVAAQLLRIADCLSQTLLPFSHLGSLENQEVVRPSGGKQLAAPRRQIAVAASLPFLRQLLERALLFCQTFCPSDATSALLLQRLGLLSLLQGNIRHAAACTALALRNAVGVLRPLRGRGADFVSEDALARCLGRDGLLVKSFSHMFMQRLRVQGLLSLRSSSIQAQYAVLLQLWQLRCGLRSLYSPSSREGAAGTDADSNKEDDKELLQWSQSGKHGEAAAVAAAAPEVFCGISGESQSGGEGGSSSVWSGNALSQIAQKAGDSTSLLQSSCEPEAAAVTSTYEETISSEDTHRHSDTKTVRDAPPFSVPRELVDELGELTPDEAVAVLASHLQLYGAVLLRRSHCVKAFATPCPSEKEASADGEQSQSVVSSTESSSLLPELATPLPQPPEELSSEVPSPPTDGAGACSQAQEDTLSSESGSHRTRLELRMHALLSSLAEGSCSSGEGTRSGSSVYATSESESSFSTGDEKDSTGSSRQATRSRAGMDGPEQSSFVGLVNRAFLCLSASLEMQPHNGKSWALLAVAALEACHFFAAAEFARRALVLNRNQPRVWVLYALCFSASQSACAPANVDRRVLDEVAAEQQGGESRFLPRVAEDSADEDGRLLHSEASSEKSELSAAEGEDMELSSEARSSSTHFENLVAPFDLLSEPFPVKPVFWANRTPITSRRALLKHVSDTTLPASSSHAASILTDAVDELPEAPERILVLLALAHLTASVAPECTLVSPAEAAAWRAQQTKRRESRVAELTVLFLQRLGIKEEHRQMGFLHSSADRAFADGLLRGPRVCVHQTKRPKEASEGDASGTPAAAGAPPNSSSNPVASSTAVQPSPAASPSSPAAAASPASTPPPAVFCRDCAVFAFERDERLLLSTPSPVACDWTQLESEVLPVSSLDSNAENDAADDTAAEWPAPSCLATAAQALLCPSSSGLPSDLLLSLPCVCGALQKLGTAMRLVDGGRLEAAASRVQCELHHGFSNAAPAQAQEGPSPSPSGSAAAPVSPTEEPLPWIWAEPRKRSLFGTSAHVGNPEPVSVKACFVEVEGWAGLAVLFAHLQQPMLAWRAAQTAAAHVAALEKFLNARAMPSDPLDACDGVGGGGGVRTAEEMGGVASEALVERVVVWGIEVEFLLLFTRFHSLPASADHIETLEAMRTIPCDPLRAKRVIGGLPFCPEEFGLRFLGRVKPDSRRCVDDSARGLLDDIRHFRIKHPFHRGAQLLEGRLLVLMGRPTEAVETLRSACSSTEYCIDPSTDWQQEAVALVAYAQGLQQVQQQTLAIQSGARAIRLAEQAPAIKLRQAIEVELMY